MPVNNMNQKGFIVIPALIWWVLGAVVLTSVAVKEGAISIEYPPKTQKKIIITAPSPTPLPTYKPNPTPTPTPTKKPVQKTAPTINSDPVITCSSSYPNCSGQSVKVKQSACSNIVCCQVGDKWSIYLSREECKKAQELYWGDYPARRNAPPSSSPVIIPCNTELGSNFGYGNTKEEAEQNCRSLQNDILAKLGGSLIECKINAGAMGVISEKLTQAECDKLKNKASTTYTTSQYNPQYTSPAFSTPAPLMIQVEPEPCVVVPPGFGGATSGRVNEAGFPCAN